MSKTWLWMLTVWFVWLFAPAVRAGNDEALVALVGDEAQPAVVCVVTEKQAGAESPANAKPEEWHPRSTEQVFGKPAEKEVAKENPDKGNTVFWNFQNDASSEEANVEHPAAKARQLLFRKPNPAVVFSSQRECAPELHLARRVDRHVFCARNPLARSEGSGVAVLELDYGTASARTVNLVSMAGNLVTLNFRPLNLRAIVPQVSVRVAGGHFRTTTYELLSGRVAQLNVEPRCYLREVELPAVAGAAPVVLPTLKLPGGREWTSPEVTLRPRLAVALPRVEAARTVLTLQVKTTLTEPKPDERGITGEFSAEWTSEVPPVVPELRVQKVTFDWHKPCEYPYDECPAIRLASTGVVVHGRVVGDDTCRYAVSRSERSFKLPEDVTFQHTKLPEWSSQLSNAGQRLEAYSSAELRQLVIHMSWHDSTRLPGDEIDSVEILGPSGVRHEVAPQEFAQISVPYASCGDKLTYTLQGSRQFSSDKVEVGRGPIDVPLPEETASFWEIGVSGGAGFMFARKRDDRPFVGAEVGLRLQPTSRLKSPHPWYSRLDYELAFSYHYAEQPYQPLHSPDFAEDEAYESVPYNRFLLSSYVTWAFADFHLGPGVGGGFGYPVFSDHQTRAGAENLIAVVAARCRYSISDVWEVVGTPRVLFGEEIYRYTPADDLASTPKRTPDDVTSFMIDFALQGWL